MLVLRSAFSRLAYPIGFARARGAPDFAKTGPNCEGTAIFPATTLRRSSLKTPPSARTLHAVVADRRMREIDVGTLLEERRLGAFQLQILFLGVLILFVDGLDFSASNVGAPAIARAFNVDRSAMSVVLSSGFFGILVGSFAFGYLGDKIGRRWGAILGVLAYSVPGLFSVFTHSLNELAALRFLTGLGMGGVVPNVIAFLTETAPKPYRVTFVMLGYVGYSLGNAAIAQVAAWFIPDYGWSIVFEVAGAVGLVL